jgi:hypothetical protein
MWFARKDSRMAKTNSAKLAVLALLAVICGWLVYRNILTPSRVASPDRSSTASANERLPAELAPQRPAAVSRGRTPEKTLSAQELAALDPTLRVDLLKKTQNVQYQNGSRNIFQFYVPPPPKPVAPAMTTPQPVAPPPPPPPPSIPLKFYGMSTRPGSPEKTAFLTDGEEIFMGKEGEIVNKRYKIVRIAVNSLEWEDTQTHQRGQLPLIVE